MAQFAQLSLDAADRLHDALTARGSPMHYGEAGRELFALRTAPSALVRQLVDGVVRGDDRFAWQTPTDVALRAWDAAGDLAQPLELATYVVVDLETTGASAATCAIVEIGAVRVHALSVEATFARLVDPGRPLPPLITQITGLRDRDVRRRPRIARPLDEFLRFSAGAVLVAHNARFDVGFLDAALRRSRGARVAAPVVDTVALARRLLAGRLERMNLATLARRFDTSVAPCHRALPDAQATAEVFLHLVGLAQERGATTVEDLVALSAPAERRARTRRSLARAVPDGPGVYVFRGPGDVPLYIGKASDLRSRVRSYFAGGRMRPAVEAAVEAAERIETRPLGSELEAALLELELIARERPAANVRATGAARRVYLRLTVDEPVPRLSVSRSPPGAGGAAFGPFRSPRDAQALAAAVRTAFGLRTCRPRAPSDDGTCLAGIVGRCHAPCRGGEHADRYAAGVAGALRWLSDGAGPQPRDALRRRLDRLQAQLRYEEAAVLRDELGRVRRAERTLGMLRGAVRRSGILLAPDLDDRFVQAFACCGGAVVARRRVPRSGDGLLELEPLVGALAAALDRPRPPGLALAPAALEPAGVVAAAFSRPGRAVQVVAVDRARLGSAAARAAARRGRVPLRA